jgi:predicted SprT family Zn-dependent metalloprotease
MNATIRARVRQVIGETCDTCGCPEMKEKISFSFNGRFTSKMGDAIFYRSGPNAGWGRVRFSTPLWPRATEEKRDNTVIHEVCHVLADYIHGKRCKHGWQWKALMMKCGQKPERCHRVDTSGLRKSNKKVSCGCREFEFGPIRYKKVLNGHRYVCNHCKQPVRPTNGDKVADVPVDDRPKVWCGCGERRIGPTQYRRIKRGTHVYHCTKCDQKILANKPEDRGNIHGFKDGDGFGFDPVAAMLTMHNAQQAAKENK